MGKEMRGERKMQRMGKGEDKESQGVEGRAGRKRDRGRWRYKKGRNQKENKQKEGGGGEENGKVMIKRCKAKDEIMSEEKRKGNK